MSAVKFRSRPSLPEPVMAAVIAIIATRVFNLLMILLKPDGDSSAELWFQLSPLTGYLLVLLLAILTFVFDTACALALLYGSRLSRQLFVGFQCLLVLLMLLPIPGEGVASVFGIDPQDARQLGQHILLQKLPDILIILMLCLPVSSRRFFRRR